MVDLAHARRLGRRSAIRWITTETISTVHRMSPMDRNQPGRLPRDAPPATASLPDRIGILAFRGGLRKTICREPGGGATTRKAVTHNNATLDE